jgi:hypothetical protein
MFAKGLSLVTKPLPLAAQRLVISTKALVVVHQRRFLETKRLVFANQPMVVSTKAIPILDERHSLKTKPL